MTGAEARLTALMTLMRQLQDVMRTENGLLREMRLARLQDLQAEKAALAETYELELRRLRQAPELMDSLSADRRQLLETAMRDFQATVRGNADRLQQSSRVVEALVQVIGVSLGTAAKPAPGYGRPAAAAADGASARVIPLAFDRRC